MPEIFQNCYFDSKKLHEKDEDIVIIFLANLSFATRTLVDQLDVGQEGTLHY